MGYGKTEIPPPEFKYFISYFYEMHDGYTGYGMATATRGRPIDSFEDVQGIAGAIKKDTPKFKEVIIQNWILLKS